MAHVEIACAAAETATARSAAAELAEIAARFGSVALSAAAAAAEGRIQLAEGDAAGALGTLQRAQRLWQEAGVPYEAARMRAALADGHFALGDAESAALELRAARQTFERLGAVPDDRRVAATLRSIAGAAEPAAADAAEVVRTFMFTDIVDSTPLAEAIGDDAWGPPTTVARRNIAWSLRAPPRRRGRPCGGRLFRLVRDADHALGCAVEIQRTLTDHRRGHGFAPSVRIGLHTCEAIRSGSGYRGKGIHTAARIGAHARSGEIIASAATLAGVETALPISERRTVKLKGIAAPVEVAAVLWA